MLEKIDLNQAMDKQAYKTELPALEKRLASLQEQIKDMKIPVIIAFEGWSASGKGTMIGRIVYPLDPRFFNVYTMSKINEDAAMRPFLWNYWIKTPESGLIAIFDKSWHRLILPNLTAQFGEHGQIAKRLLKPDKKPAAGPGPRLLNEAEAAGFYQDVNSFEKHLADDGALIIKLFLHIGKDEQRKRFRELEKNPDTAWRVAVRDWEQNRNYEEYVKLYSEILSQTGAGERSWSIVEANDRKFATVKTYKVIIKRIEDEIYRRQQAEKHAEREQDPALKPPGVSILSGVDLSKTVVNAEYKKEIAFLQGRIAELGYKLYAKRRSVAIAYEGWDAAGKGGNIKRVTEHLDPRAYEVIPVGVPTQEELSHHYLWRFYNKFPKDGHIAIFDRSWYGRVLVERVEELTPPEVWRRAYREINDMERHLYNHGVILFKFWMHIDPEEQLQRFKAREADPLKQYKITGDDWRNRNKWDAYVEAVDEMLLRTNTDYAPWTVVESNCKKYARVKTLRIITEELEKRLRG
ncbi:MAG: phosphate--AMP phosphotransferase [Defluviitaleaceae bacterium]|nr:phosphate--AMP phosphotransferase [Defluviitaleaceae bacterium]